MTYIYSLKAVQKVFTFLFTAYNEVKVEQLLLMYMAPVWSQLSKASVFVVVISQFRPLVFNHEPD